MILFIRNYYDVMWNVSRNVTSISTIVIQVNRFLVRSWWFTPEYSQQPIARPFPPFRPANLQTETLVIGKEVLFSASETYSSCFQAARWSRQQFRNKRPSINFWTLHILCAPQNERFTFDVANIRRPYIYMSGEIWKRLRPFIKFQTRRINKTLK